MSKKKPTKKEIKAIIKEASKEPNSRLAEVTLESVVEDSLFGVQNWLQSKVNQIALAALGIDTTWSEWRLEDGSCLHDYIKKHVKTVAKEMIENWDLKIPATQQKSIIEDIQNDVKWQFKHEITDKVHAQVGTFIDKYVKTKVESMMEEKLKDIDKVLEKTFSEMAETSGVLADPNFGNKIFERFALHVIEQNPKLLKNFKVTKNG